MIEPGLPADIGVIGEGKLVRKDVRGASAGGRRSMDLAACGVLVLSLSLFFAVRVVFRYQPLTYLPGDCPYYAATAVSLLQDGDLDLRNQLRGGLVVHGSQIALGRGEAWFPKHPILMPVVAVPFLAAFGMPGFLVFNLLVLSTLAIVMMRLARPFASPWPAAAAAFVLLTGTFLRGYDYNFSPDLFATLILGAGFLALLRGRDAQGGFLLGLSVAAKLTHLFLVPLAPLYAAWCRGRRGAWRGAAGAAGPVLAVAALNAALFGSPFVTPYDRNLELRDGETVMVSHRGRFDQSLVRGVAGEFFDPDHGLLPTSPALLLALPGFAILLRRRPKEAVLFLAAAEFLLLFFATYRDWAASHYGNRFLMPLVALAAAPVALTLQWIGERARAALRRPRALTVGEGARS
jgi:4-amino-4-deoxy-L-arabinose transferase-like glycosyltransferase